MAQALWGNIYYQDRFAGILKQEPGGRCSFTYDPDYVEAGEPPLSFTLPVQPGPHIYEDGLHPFFDNLVAEGWLRDAQARALTVRKSDRFALLLAFGADLAGAVHVIDPAPAHDLHIALDSPQDIAALGARASLSGVQPKIGIRKEGRRYRPVRPGELASHIAKLPSGPLTNIVDNEYLTTLAAKALLPHDRVVDVEIAPIEDITERALIVTRFDRQANGDRLHFEEFNQLLGKKSEEKYDGCYEDMANFIHANTTCLKVELDTLYRRLAVCFLLGNTDAHLKNFAMMHTAQGLRLTPAYDLVSSALYPDYRTIALGLEHTHNMRLRALKAKNLIRLGHNFHLPDRAIALAMHDLQARLPAARNVIKAQTGLDPQLKTQLLDQMERRWNGTFASIGPGLSKKP